MRLAEPAPGPPVVAFRVPSSTHVRLHQNESPYAMSPTALRSAAAALEAGSRYPDAGSPDLCRTLADHYGVDPTMVAVGAGSGELILTACRAWTGDDRPVVVTEPGFPGYGLMAGIAGVPVRKVPSQRYRVGVAALMGALSRAGCLFVCNPLNPTGAVLEPGEVRALAGAATESGAVLVLDEAYAEFAGAAHHSGIDEVRAGGNLIALRTFSKAYGLAGLRVGYAIGPSRLISQLGRRLPPFTVNRVAQAAAAAALEDQAFLLSVVERVAEGRRRLEEALASLALDVVLRGATFVL